MDLSINPLFKHLFIKQKRLFYYFFEYDLINSKNKRN